MALPAHSADEPLVIYNAQHVSLTRAWTEAFTRETGIKTIVRDGGDYEDVYKRQGWCRPSPRGMPRPRVAR